MAFAYFDRVKETSTTTGTGVFTLAGAVLGFQAFSAVYANADTLHYVIFQASTGAWEVGYGTWLTGNQLQRTTVLASSNANAAVNFGAGTKEVFVQSPASIPSRQGAHFFSVVDQTARDLIDPATLRLGSIVRLISTGLFYSWTGSTWAQLPGFLPTVAAAGSTLISNGTDWVSGPLDLSDPDSHTGVLAPINGGTGIAGAGGTANRVLTTTNGSTWAAGLVALATMVTGLLPAVNFVDGAATSVFGRSAGTTGVQASIAATADGQALRRAGGVLGFGAIDLSDPDAITGLLPLSSLTGGAAVGQVLRNAVGNVPVWGAVDLADPDAVTGLLAFANFANGTATSVLARASGTTGVMASLAATADGQFLQRTAGALVWASLSVGTITGGSAVGQVLVNAAGNVPTWSAVDLADPDAVTGLLATSRISPGTAGQALITTGGVAAWGSDFGATTLTTTGAFKANASSAYLQLGLNPGSGSGVASAAATGNIRGSRGAFLSAGGTGFQISVRNNSDTGDIALLAWDSTGGLTGVGGGTNTDLNASAGWRFRNLAGSNIHAWSTNAYNGILSTFTIDPATTGTSLWSYGGSGAATGKLWSFVGQPGLTTGGALAMVAGQASDSTGTCTGGAGTWQAGPATGSGATHIGGAGLFAGGDATGSSGSRTGGPATFRSGTGATDDGDTRLQRGNSIGLQIVKPSSGLVVGLLRTAAITSTQMPANTGNGVLYVGEATTMPTTGFPASGGILGVDAALGLQWKGKNGVETTVGAYGDSGNTTKRRLIDWKSPIVRTTIASTAQFTAASIDCASLNGQSLGVSNIHVRGKFLARETSNGYASYGEFSGVFKVDASNVPSLPPTGGLASDLNPASGVIGGDGGGAQALTFTVSGTTILFRITPNVAPFATEYLAWIEVDGFTL